MANLEYDFDTVETLDIAPPLDFRATFWLWYERNKNDTVIRVGWWFVKFSVKVSDLRPLFEKIFGRKPESV